MYVYMYICMEVTLQECNYCKHISCGMAHFLCELIDSNCQVGSKATNRVALRDPYVCIYVYMYGSNATGMQLLQTHFLWDGSFSV